MILFKRKQLTQEYFIQFINEGDFETERKSDLYLRETLTQIEYFDKEVNANPPVWFKVKNEKKTKVNKSKALKLEEQFQNDLDKSINQFVKKEAEQKRKKEAEKKQKKLSTKK